MQEYFDPNQNYGTFDSKVRGLLIGVVPIGAAVGAFMAPLFISYFSRR
jgi:hypothetical protein